MENRKIIIYSLFADLLGVLLFIFAIQIHNKIILYTSDKLWKFNDGMCFYEVFYRYFIQKKT